MLRQGKKRDAIEVWPYPQDRASSLPPRPSGHDAGSAANSVKPTRADVERASAVKKVFTLPPNYTNQDPPSSTAVRPRQGLRRPCSQGVTEVHASILAAYLGPDPLAGKCLAQIASSRIFGNLPNEVRQIDILEHRLLRPGRCAQIVIIDCREWEQHGYGHAKLPSELVQLALVSEDRLDREAVFSDGYSDYLLWPLIEQEVVSRLTACVAQIARRSAPLFFSADPLIQKACALLAQRVDQQIALGELARIAGTNKTTLVNRFEAAFGCGPMTWFRHYRMMEAAARLRSGHESVAEVAESLGYENSNNFSTAFKAIHGLSPLRYRKMAARRERSA